MPGGGPDGGGGDEELPLPQPTIPNITVSPRASPHTPILFIANAPSQFCLLLKFPVEGMRLSASHHRRRP